MWPGIAESDQGRVFEMFTKLQAGPGSGMGLAIVHRIVDRNGGSVRVISDGEAGSTFVCTLPAAIAGQHRP
ncbi:MAG: HAMP domain-containing sensor histidine kinase [Candidatus Nanopelagicales bacterium]|nr:HAMP domain-containing sensor histidine kinase [Candidatus Nanopelagicales bacterium]